MKKLNLEVTADQLKQVLDKVQNNRWTAFEEYVFLRLTELNLSENMINAAERGEDFYDFTLNDTRFYGEGMLTLFKDFNEFKANFINSANQALTDTCLCVCDKAH